MHPLRLACHAMGCRFELVLGGHTRDPANLRSMGELALAEVVDLDARLSRFRPDSLLAHLQRQPLGHRVRADARTISLLAEAMAVWAASDGLFDIAFGEDPYGHGEHVSSPTGGHGAPSGPARPPALAIDEAASTVARLREGVLDLGGIAKGHAIDAALEVLRDHGVTSAFIHGGTSAVGAIGAPPDQDAWEVAIAVPEGVAMREEPLRGPPAALRQGSDPVGRNRLLGLGPHRLVIPLRDACLAVSAPHGRATEAGHHIIDPRTGRSAKCAALAVVAGPSCRTCDAWTKPLIIERRRPRALPDECRAWIGCDGSPGADS